LFRASMLTAAAQNRYGQNPEPAASNSTFYFCCARRAWPLYQSRVIPTGDSGFAPGGGIIEISPGYLIFYSFHAITVTGTAIFSLDHNTGHGMGNRRTSMPSAGHTTKMKPGGVHPCRFAAPRFTP
ncbi:MAG: hypothetical protein R6V54_08780, partial [Desulfobacteraceae bacterium]